MAYTPEELEAFLTAHSEVESTEDFSDKTNDLYIACLDAMHDSLTLVEFLDNLTLNQAKILLYGIAAINVER